MALNLSTSMSLEKDDLDSFAIQIREELPGLEMVNNPDPNVGIEGALLVPKHIIDHGKIFIDSVFDQIKALVVEGNFVRICIPLNGGLLAYYELLKRFAAEPELLKLENCPQFVFAAKNGTGKDQYSLTTIQGQTDVFMLIDDIFDKGGSSSNILAQAPQVETRAEFFATKVGKAHSQLSPIHVLPDEWIKTCYGMNGGLAMDDPKLEAQIELAERECALPLMQISKEEIRKWSPEQIQKYLEILKTCTYFDKNSTDFQNFDFLLRAIQHAENYVQKLELIQGLTKMILVLIINGQGLPIFAEMEG